MTGLDTGADLTAGVVASWARVLTDENVAPSSRRSLADDLAARSVRHEHLRRALFIELSAWRAAHASDVREVAEFDRLLRERMEGRGDPHRHLPDAWWVPPDDGR